MEEEFEHGDHFMDEEGSDDEIVRANASILEDSRQQADDLDASSAPAATEAPPADDAVASASSLASTARVRGAIPSEISDVRSCASVVSMPPRG